MFIFYLLKLLFAGSCSSSSAEAYDKSFESQQRMLSLDFKKTHQTSFGDRDYKCDKRSLADIQMTELPIQEFSCSPPPAKRPDVNYHNYPPDVTSTTQDKQSLVSPSNLEPPPPPRGQPPCTGANNQTGILRGQGVPVTPGTMKKRVQIQEISV